MSLTNLSQRTKTSDRLFYNQYKYCFKLFIPHAPALSSLDHEHVDEILNMREHLWEKSRSINFGGSWRVKEDYQITPALRHKLHRAVNFFNRTDDCKLVIVQSFMYVYTNRYTMRDDFINLDFDINQITTIKVNRPLGTVKSSDQANKIRCYFKQLKVTDKEYDLLKKFIENNIEVVNPSIGLELFFDRSTLRLLRNYYFIDFPEASMITTLELTTPNLIRKILPIVK